ncbi:MAG: hypothetical protein NZ903_03370 [Candidatus Micrarchaeota archaeon]|nr:hypothetical protein [Candidatus Micrarchaeota archaeon]
MKKLTSAEKISEIEKISPITAKVLAKLNEKLAEHETKINE